MRSVEHVGQRAPEEVTRLEFRYTYGSKATAEFVGTFFLVLTIGLNVINGSVGDALSIGAVLMVMVYAMGNISGGHFNPAVTIAVLLAGRRKIATGAALGYIFIQCVAAFLAAAFYYGLTGHTFMLKPVGLFSWGQAMAVEILYSAALIYVILNTATCGINMYYGLAIGFTLVSAAMAAGGISGCCLNPAVAIGTLSMNALVSPTPAVNFVAYTGAPIVGALLATGAFYVVRKDDQFTAK